MKIVIATRRSKLALWQAEHVAEKLREAAPDADVTLLPLSTKGDRIVDVSLSKIGGKGLFLKELERALLDGDADIAVHSMKDVPAQLPDGLHIAAILAREDPRDALLGSRLDELPHGATVGTSSLRRAAQLAHYRRDLHLEPLRGNVETRIAKLHGGDYDAIVLAAAGLKRLGLTKKIDEMLDPSICLPAIGQGAIGVECRKDSVLNALVAGLEDSASRMAVDAERALNAGIGGSCVSPLAGHATVAESLITLRAVVGHPDGSDLISVIASADSAEAVGLEAASLLMQHGAKEIFDAVADD